MIFYGWGRDLQRVAYAGIEKCPNCKNFGNFWICETVSYAGLYFVKLAKWNKKRFYMCETCQKGAEIEPSKIDTAIAQTIAIPTPEESAEMWTQFSDEVHSAIEGIDDEVKIATEAGFALARAATALESRYQPAQVEYIESRYVQFLTDMDRPH